MDNTIRRFREFNRFYTGLLGVLRRSFLGKRLGLPEARVLFEVRENSDVNAMELTRTLDMDKGQVSRILKKLVELGLVSRSGRPSGRKAVPLALTEEGAVFLSDLDQAADRQARRILSGLDAERRDELGRALDTVRRLLQTPDALSNDQTVVIREARAGDLGRLSTGHAEMYDREWGLGPTFEHYVIQGLAEYTAKADQPGSRVWVAEIQGNAAGYIGIVKTSESEAQLRWFLVEPHARGKGVGRMLLDTALDFSRAHGFKTLFLWTFKGLEAAAHLYAGAGFTLSEEKAGRMGEREVLEQKWVLPLLSS